MCARCAVLTNNNRSIALHCNEWKQTCVVAFAVVYCDICEVPVSLPLSNIKLDEHVFLVTVFFSRRSLSLGVCSFLWLLLLFSSALCFVYSEYCTHKSIQHREQEYERLQLSTAITTSAHGHCHFYGNKNDFFDCNTAAHCLHRPIFMSVI